MKPFALPLVVVSLLSLPSVAAAQITQVMDRSPAEHADFEAEPIVTGQKGPTYTVTFVDDAIDATLNDGNIPRIQVRPARGYGQLSRPRLHFVSEMLKSVELM